MSKKKREKICEYCGKTYKASYEKQRYCSRSCSSKSKGLIEKKRICKRCGKIYIQPKGEYSLFCSEECRIAQRRERNQMRRRKSEEKKEEFDRPKIVRLTAHLMECRKNGRRYAEDQMEDTLRMVGSVNVNFEEKRK